MMNIVLVPIPEIGIHGAAWGSVACHVVAFTIAISSLRKNIQLDLSFSKFVIKPVIAVTIMGICSYFSYLTLSGMMPGGDPLSTVLEKLKVYEKS